VWQPGNQTLDVEEDGMYAAVVTVTIDEGKDSEAQQMLKDVVIPMVKGSAGFVAGYWLAPQGDKGWSIAMFDTEDNARAAAPPEGMRPPGAPVVVDHVEFREVIASA
jgi:hypothetical protein